MGKDLELTIKGRDEASKVLKDVKESTEDITKATEKQSEATGKSAFKYTEMLSAISLVQQAFGALQNVLESTMGKWIEQAQAVSDFNAMIDGNVEETSVLIELSTDFGITQDTLLASMRMLAKNGIEPNIEGLIKVRRQLDGCANEADRLKMAQELLGEQGIKQLIPMFDQLTDEQLRNYVDTLTEAEMWTEEEIARSQELRKAMSDLGDMFDNVLVQIGGFLAEGLLPYFEILSAIPDVIAVIRGEEVKHIEVLGDVAEAHADVAEEIENAQTALEDYTEQMWLQEAAAALIRGDVETARHYAEIAREIERSAEATSSLIALLDALDGKVVTAEVLLRVQQLGGTWVTDEMIQQQLYLQETGGGGDSSGGGGGTVVFRGQTYRDAYWRGDQLIVRGKVFGTFAGRQELGGEFTIGGHGGPDSQPVGFMGTPGEKVKVTRPGEGEELGPLLDEIRAMRLEFGRLANTLPITLRDAVERAL